MCRNKWIWDTDNIGYKGDSSIEVIQLRGVSLYYMNNYIIMCNIRSITMEYGVVYKH